MKAELLLKDRIVIGSTLPPKGNFEDLIVYDDIREKLKLTQEEIVKFGVSTIPGTSHTIWKNTADLFSYEFTDLECSKLKKALEDLSKKNELSADHMNLYRVFVKGEKIEIPVIEKKPEPKKKETPKEEKK